jgi:hypothetical protein
MPNEPTELLRHDTVSEIAGILRVSDDTARKIFASEPGVLRIGSSKPARGRIRGHVTLRVPVDVFLRVHRRLQGIS